MYEPGLVGGHVVFTALLAGPVHYRALITGEGLDGSRTRTQDVAVRSLQRLPNLEEFDGCG